MDRSIGLKTLDRQRAIERLTQFVAASFDSARTSDAPFYHLQFDRVFPDDVYAAMLSGMPVSSDYRPMSGRAKGNDLADGTHTRVKIDLFPEYIRKLPPDKRPVWDIVGHALCSRPVKEALVRRLAPRPRQRFGQGFPTGRMEPGPLLKRATPWHKNAAAPGPPWEGQPI